MLQYRFLLKRSKQENILTRIGIDLLKKQYFAELIKISFDKVVFKICELVLSFCILTYLLIRQELIQVNIKLLNIYSSLGPLFKS